MCAFGDWKCNEARKEIHREISRLLGIIFGWKSEIFLKRKEKVNNVAVSSACYLVLPGYQGLSCLTWTMRESFVHLYLVNVMREFCRIHTEYSLKVPNLYWEFFEKYKRIYVSWPTIDLSPTSGHVVFHATFWHHSIVTSQLHNHLTGRLIVTL